MLLIKILFLVYLVAIGEGKRTKILNGIVAQREERPFQVSLQHATKLYHFCGGAIINENYIVTAAHCALSGNSTFLPEQIRVAFDIANNSPQVVHNVTNIYMHEKYNKSDSGRNDIALFKVAPRITFSKYVAPVALPAPHFQARSNIKAVVSGWGTVRFPYLAFPLNLQKLSVTLVDEEYCKRLYRGIKNIYHIHLCTHDVSGAEKGTCIGDSGGPLTINNNTLIGIVSWSRKDPTCGSHKYPDVYTKVSEYIDWIYKHTV